jgi:hypothetical protein
MLAPLRDINGNIRYVLGAQIDVSNLVPDSANLAGAASRKTTQVGFMSATGTPENANKKDDLRDLSEMLDLQDRGKIQKWRASTMQEHLDEEAGSTTSEWRRSGGLLRDQSFDSLRDNDLGGWVNSRLSGFYQNVSHFPIVRRRPLTLAVSCYSTLPVFACSLRFPISANTWHPAITHPRED